MEKEQIRFPSTDGVSTVAGFLYPTEVPPRAIVQISHGMIDHSARYEEMISALVAGGYAVAANDHLGHGMTANGKENLGYFGRRGAREAVVGDLHKMSAIARERFPGVPLILLGHSMGSFLARMYAARWGAELDGLILLGTGGRNPALPVGILLADLLTLLRGPHYRSYLLARLTFAGYGKRYGPDAPKCAWITRDDTIRLRYLEDPLCHYIFTVSAYRELFGMTGAVNRGNWFRRLPENLPILVSSGDMDPVGGYVRGVNEVVSRLRKSGHGHLTSRLYPGARHELHSELDRSDFFADLLAWLGSVVG